MSEIVSRPAPAVTGPAATSVRPGRLFTLYLRTRHAPAAAGALVAFGLFFWADLHWRWSIAGGPAAQQLVPLTVVAGAASVVGVATHGPFGEPERATGRRLPYVRLGSVLLLTAFAIGVVLAGATGGHLAAGDLALVRDVAGSVGLGLLTASVLGGAFAWIGPISYWLVIESALANGLSAFYLWPTRPAHDAAAAVCAVAVVAAGCAAVTVGSAAAPQRLT